MAHDERAIRDVHTTFIAAVTAADLQCVLGLMTDDVVLLGPGQAPHGRDQFPVGFLAAPGQSHLRCVSDLQEVVVAGDVAYTLCRDALSVTPRAGGETVAMAGNRITLYRQQPGGRWQLVRDAHTVSPAANWNPARH